MNAGNENQSPLHLGKTFGPDQNQSPDEPGPVDSLSLAIVAVIVFVGDSSRGVLFPVLWSLCKSLGGNVVDLGYLVAMFSLGRLVVTVPLGCMCDKYGHKVPLLLCSTTLCVGAVLWANCTLSSNLGFLYASQFIMGCGSGSLGLTRSYVVENSDPKARTKSMALMTALQYAGFTVSPALGSALQTLGDQIGTYWKFALPAYAIALLSFYCIIALISVFRNLQLHVSEDIGSEKTDLSASSKKKKVSSSSQITFVFAVMIILNVTTKGSIAVYETLGSQISSSDYGLSSNALGALITSSGAIGFVQLLLFKPFWAKYFNDLELILGGIGLMVVAQMVMISYDGNRPSVQRYIVTVILMYSLGYPIGHTAVLGAFSKIQKSGHQAALMGWFATAGSLARIVLPIGAGYLDTLFDNSPFCLVLALLVASYGSIVYLLPTLKETIEDSSGGGSAILSMKAGAACMFRNASLQYPIASLNPACGATLRSTPLAMREMHSGGESEGEGDGDDLDEAIEIYRGSSELCVGKQSSRFERWHRMRWEEKCQILICVALFVFAWVAVFCLSPAGGKFRTIEFDEPPLDVE